jgi:uncharacterized protein (DUF58 family)
MFSDSWVVIILLAFGIGAVLRSEALLLVTFLMATASVVARGWNGVVLRRVEYTRQLGTLRAFVGEQVALEVAVTNRKPLPVPWLSVRDAFPANLTLVDHDLKPSSIPGRAYLSHLVSLGPYERLRWTYEIDCAQRGFYFFGPTQAKSGDILGFFAREERWETPGRLIIYPRVQPLPELGFPGKDPFGEQKTRHHLVEDPVRTVGVRDYHPEDSIKRVHWKASARHTDLQVKVYEPVITRQLVVFLNVASFTQTWQGIIPEWQEQAISVAASIAYHTVEKDFAIGLMANGSVPHSDQPIRVLPSRDPDHLTRVLEALAAVTAYATSSIDKLLLAESPRLSLGATLVVVTTIVTEPLLTEMVRLRDAGRRLALVSLDPDYQEEGAAGITTYHIPLAEADFSGVWTRSITEEEPTDWRRDGRGAEAVRQQ